MRPLTPETGARSFREGLLLLLKDRRFWLAVIVAAVLIWASSEGATAGLGGLVLVVFIYFLPSWIARKKHNATAVFILNLFLGWTLIGWVVALSWATNNPPAAQTVAPPVQPNAGMATKRCPFCAEQILEAAVVCKHCGRDLAPL